MQIYCNFATLMNIAKILIIEKNTKANSLGQNLGQNGNFPKIDVSWVFGVAENKSSKKNCNILIFHCNN